MRKFRYTIIGFLFFTLTVSFNVIIGVLLYSWVNKEESFIKCCKCHGLNECATISKARRK